MGARPRRGGPRVPTHWGASSAVPAEVIDGLRHMAEVVGCTSIQPANVRTAIAWIDQLGDMVPRGERSAQVPARRWRFTCVVGDPAGQVSASAATRDEAQTRALARFRLEMGRDPDAHEREVTVIERPVLR